MLLNSKKSLKCKLPKRDLLVARTGHHRARLIKYYPRPPCAPSFIKSIMLRPLQTHFLLFQQIFFIPVCIHAGTYRVPPRVLASESKPFGVNNAIFFRNYPLKINGNVLSSASQENKNTPAWTCKTLFLSNINE